MDDEIDLRAYIAVLLRYKFWILGLALFAAVAAFVVSSVLPPTYEATALVAATKPSYIIAFDPRVQTQRDLQPSYRAYLALALGDELVAKVEEALAAERPSSPLSAFELREMIEATNGTDQSVIHLAVQDQDPARAATIANLWAGLFVESTNQLYGQSEQDLRFFEAQMRDAEAALSSAEEALIAFQARNQAMILETQLGSKRAALQQYLAGARSLRLIIEDARSLRARLEAQDPSLRASLSDEIASLFVEIESLNSKELPIQLQLSGQQGLSVKTVGEQAAYLASLISALEEKFVILEAGAEGLEPDILQLQQRLQEQQAQAARLVLAKEVAEETFRTLTRKVAETRIAVQDTEGSVRLASRAAIPVEPVGPRRLINTLIAGALGGFLAVFGVFGLEYWHSGEPERED